MTWRAPPPPPLLEGAVHVWRVRINDGAPASHALLSIDEREHATRLLAESHRHHYVRAHTALRRILALYLVDRDATVSFDIGPYGKPLLPADEAHHGVHFNLSHSGNLALIAVARHRAVGIDVERWNKSIDHVRLAERFFSESERAALVALGASRLTEGFFTAWSRKEAYIKATGHGVSRGLEHFDVQLTPDAPAALLADRLDHDACERWIMSGIDAGPGYSAALVAEAPVHEVLLFEAPTALSS